ncbi:MAG: metalloregulator ArsR/SmtB family transcription factor [Chloroflexota bacterium]
MKELTRAVHALSDETRVRIINLIMERECCVCEVMQALNISQTRASRNLKILYDAGFLNMRNDGLFTLYSINSESNDDFYAHLLQAVRKDLQTNTTARKDLRQLAKTKRVRPGFASRLVQ